MKKKKSIKTLFWINTTLFLIVILSVFTQVNIQYLPIMLGLMTVLGLLLVYHTIKKKVKKPLKNYLLMTGWGVSGFTILTISHNLLYALHELTKWLMFEILEVIVFLTAIIVCPIVFITGMIGAIYLRKRLK